MSGRGLKVAFFLFFGTMLNISQKSAGITEKFQSVKQNRTLLKHLLAPPARKLKSWKHKDQEMVPARTHTMHNFSVSQNNRTTGNVYTRFYTALVFL